MDDKEYRVSRVGYFERGTVTDRWVVEVKDDIPYSRPQWVAVKVFGRREDAERLLKILYGDETGAVAD